MENIYKALTEYEGNDWESLLERLSVSDVFLPLAEQFTEPGSLRMIIRYIAWTYSLESKQLMQGVDWEHNKKNNFRLSGLPDNMWGEVGLLQNPLVLDVIQKWLAFQDSPVFKQILMLKDLKMEMELAALSALSSSSRSIDYDQKYKNAGYAIELGKMISGLEAELLRNNGMMKEAFAETKSKKSSSIGPEKFAHN